MEPMRARSPCATGSGWRVAPEGSRVLLLELEQLGEECWGVLTEAGGRLSWAASTADGVCALIDEPAGVASPMPTRTLR
jgi:hypothetical protein